jgi:hypothetical protein
MDRERDREFHTSTNTPHEHEFKPGDRAQQTTGFFSAACWYANITLPIQSPSGNGSQPCRPRNPRKKPQATMVAANSPTSCIPRIELSHSNPMGKDKTAIGQLTPRNEAPPF